MGLFDYLVVLFGVLKIVLLIDFCDIIVCLVVFDLDVCDVVLLLMDF